MATVDGFVKCEARSQTAVVPLPVKLLQREYEPKQVHCNFRDGSSAPMSLPVVLFSMPRSPSTFVDGVRLEMLCFARQAPGNAGAITKSRAAELQSRYGYS